MKKFYFTPGPSQLYFTVEEHLKNALKEGIHSISHRSKRFQEIFQACSTNLKELLELPKNYEIAFTASATEIWERIGQNLIERESFHFVNGAFSQKFEKVINQLGKTTLNAEVSLGEVVDVEKILIPETTELISMTYNETSTGASHTMEDVKKIRSGFENQLLALDVVSAAPGVHIDFSEVDTAYLSVQKCFGLPSGLGVWIYNDRCLAKAESLLNKGNSIGSYHALPELMAKAAVNQTPETPNVLGIYLLSKVSEDLLKKGLTQIRQETNYKNAILQHMIANSPYLDYAVKNKINRSKTTIVANTNVDSSTLIEHLENKGLVLGAGYGSKKKEQIRIANFPTHSKEQIEMLSDIILDLNI